jgi:hypothetical protein
MSSRVPGGRHALSAIGRRTFVGAGWDSLRSTQADSTAAATTTAAVAFARRTHADGTRERFSGERDTVMAIFNDGSGERRAE